MGGVGWGGACANVHVNLLGKWTRLCVCRYVRVDMGGMGWGMGGMGAGAPPWTIQIPKGSWKNSNSCSEKKKSIRRCPLEVRSISLVSTSFTCMNACLWL